MNQLNRQQGIVSYWRDDKGFGFIQTSAEQRLFFHIRDFQTTPLQRPQKGDHISFAIGQDKQQRTCATSLQLEQSHTASLNTIKAKTTHYTDYVQIQNKAFWFRYLFFVLTLMALLAGTFLFAVPLFYLQASLFTYWLYQIDKNLAASGHASRLSEESLQMFSLIGGWPGALVAQKRLHHKVHKNVFQREFRFVIYGNSCFLLWLLSKPGSHFLQKIALF